MHLIRMEDHWAEMEISLGDTLSKLEQLLYDQVYRRVYEKGDIPAHASSLQRVQSELDAQMTHMDQECEILSLVQKFIAETTSIHMAEKISAIRTRRNRHCPIYRLPNELTSAIFVLANDNRAKSLQMRIPFVVSQVSKAWREIALNTPTLWTIMDVLTRPIAQTFLTRSKSALLEIDLLPGPDCCHLENPPSSDHRNFISAYESYVPDLTNFFSPVIPHTNRWRSLRVEGVAPGVLEPLLCAPAPQLEVFHIGVRGSGPVLPSLPLQAELFANHTPCIRHLHLSGFYQPLTSSIYTGLTSLRLNLIVFPSDSVHQLLGNLAQCPLLKQLLLGDISLLPAGASATPSRPPINNFALPHLRLACFVNLDAAILHPIFSFIQFPPSLFLRTLTKGDLSALFPPLTDQTAPFPGLALVRTLEIRGQRDRGTSVSIIGGAGRGVAGFHLTNIPLPALEDHSTPERMSRQITSYIACQSIHTLTLRYLRVECIRPSALAQLLLSLPAITSLSFLSSSPSFLEPLLVTSSPRLCPSLRTLRISVSEVTEACLIDLVISRTRSGGGDSVDNDVQPLATLELSACSRIKDKEVLERVLARFVELRWGEQWDTAPPNNAAPSAAALLEV
ncbi:hypothetical protein BOTBODRAFT_58331 [Botryobasidium botryosum FD-172 SS1]|uniref:Uncharacterized protein n=1 Tax=Botryobasidium botryosum (strain FD-172 SS1) TaxID=930990 RepID=A0A067M328_BOTB1|nr:hypothetical protein BOTBODRAFT_58331 [Botryobasidium botryosum FD-172 SS1]